MIIVIEQTSWKNLALKHFPLSDIDSFEGPKWNIESLAKALATSDAYIDLSGTDLVRLETCR